MIRTLIFTICLFLLTPCLLAFPLSQDLQEGDKLYEQNKYLESIPLYEKALEMNPEDYEALWRLSRSCDMQSNNETKKSAKKEILDNAVNYAERAISANEDGFEGHLYLAQSLGKMSSVVGSEEKVKNTFKIRDAAQKAIELKPSHYKAYMLLGMWHRKVEAATWLEKNLAQMFFGGLPDASLEEAERNLKKSLELRYDNLEVHYELALVYEKLKRKDEAVKELKEASQCTVRNKRQAKIKENVIKLLKRIK